jgi:RNA polymerase sigma-70 factor (ECF subfamily)
VKSCIIKEIKDGNEQCFKNLFETYYSDLVVFAFGILQDRECAEDIVQNFFVNFWCKRKSLKIESSFEGYFYRSVRNACLNQIRNRKNRELKIKEMALDTTVIQYDESDKDEHSDLNALYKAISLLPDQRRKIFMLCCFDNIKYHDVAKLLNISVNTVRTQMGRAYKSLRKHLEERY